MHYVIWGTLTAPSGCVNAIGKSIAFSTEVSTLMKHPKQVGRKAKVCYPGYNRYDNETENFIERYLGKNG